MPKLQVFTTQAVVLDTTQDVDDGCNPPRVYYGDKKHSFQIEFGGEPGDTFDVKVILSKQDLQSLVDECKDVLGPFV